MNALLLIDLQNDFLPGGTLAVPRGDEVLVPANQLQACFELVVATQDWHPADHGSFAANHPGKQPGDVIELDGRPQVLWPIHCVAGTPGAALVAGLNTAHIAQVFRKGTDPLVDSYSGFFDNGRHRGTGLAEFLHARGVTDVYILGLATDYCVKFTALDARRLRLRTFLIADACRGVEHSRGDVAAAIAEMRQAGVEVTTSAEVPRLAGRGWPFK
jgi:nicotinamidase/pyrazinamidase